MGRMYKVHDRVKHRDYPGTHGSVVAVSGHIVLVLWDEDREPGNVDNSVDLPGRTSRHIPWALQPV